MKTRITNLVLLPLLMGGLGLMVAGQVAAQTFTTLHSFTATNPITGINGDGANPYGLVLAGNTLNGTAAFGGTSGNGTAFALNIDGTAFTNLYSFTATNPITGINSDGNEPNGSILSGNTLYGTATFGGSSGNGTVFALNSDGTGFTNLHSFTALDAATGTTNSDGANPYAGLILSGNELYGTAQGGGIWGNGTVFRVNTDGTGFTNLHSFTALDAATSTTNSDGADPYSGLILSSNVLYGTAQAGGASGNGTVFALNTDGTGFMVLHSFTALDVATGTTNSDGTEPFAGLILSGNTLYGTAYQGGASGNGTVFALNKDGSGFTTLHSFTALDAATGTTNSDGVEPFAGLILSGNTLYGTTLNGGSSGNGTVFALNTDGTGFTTPHGFTALDVATGTTNGDGANPQTGLILLGSTLYGTAFNGGSSGNGTVFRLSLPPPKLTIVSSAAGFVLKWPTIATGFTLQSTTNLGSSAVWTTNSPPPVVVNGQNTVTNPISGTQQFFRLSQ
jgi:uncharacterized repeat protein (TIGR03803 family)